MAREKILVSKKILADIGRGIYRTPANAIKELVSNAFDACATWIKITTNTPYYDVITCEDNGEGMTSDEFKKILKRIGSSRKRADRVEYKNCKAAKRPIIGKIGIGLLAVSQICDKFTIISKKKGQKEAFKATIDLLQFEKDDAYLSGEAEITLGEYEMQPIFVPDEELPISYTKIVIGTLKEGFHKTLKAEVKKQIIRFKDNAPKAISFLKLVKILSQKKDFKAISTYDYMVWELGLLCPIRYLQEKNAAFPSNKFIEKNIRRLEEYNFHLFVDGLEIYKPILFFKGDALKRENEDFKVYFLPEFNEEVAGERLKFHGYIYSQRIKIRPVELQGVLIRIKDVAIGNYDKSILKYPREEGPIFSMISGEIFFEEGLENALNIDRNSFNETHPHYQKLQLHLHKFIKGEVVKDIRERSTRRRKREKEEQISNELKALSESIKNNWNIKIFFEVKEQADSKRFLFKEKETKIIFFTKSKGWSKSEKQRIIQMKAIIAFILIEYFRDKVDVDEIISDTLF
jgi:hypothetical protein